MEQITNASGDLAGNRFGEDETSALDEEGSANHAARQLIDVARVRQCVGDPPRQIEDPQSPPCVPFWQGDNGGATSKGVTRDEVVVIANVYQNGLTRQSDVVPAAHLWVAFFNKRFEFYGRKLRIVVTPAGAGGDGQSAAQRAAAVAYDTQYQPFASTDKIDGAQFDYSLEMARRRVVATAHYGVVSRDMAQRWRPYMWTYAMAADQMMSQLGNWMCARLAGRRAAYAGRSDVEDMSTRTRVFGVILGHYRASQNLTVDPIVREMRRCGAAPARTFTYAEDGDGGSPSFQNMMLQMKQAGVTTVINFGERLPGPYPAATQQLYFPEWIVNSFNAMDSNWLPKLFATPEQWQRAFGLTFFPKNLASEDQPAVWAVREMDPSFKFPANDMETYFWRVLYKQLLLIASGVQMAGPRLTPETFEAGLHRTRFPNPDDPIQRAGAVGFTADWSMTDDAAEIWWNPSAKGPQNDDAGAYCYIDGGIRYTMGRYPTDPDEFFQPPCDTGAR